MAGAGLMGVGAIRDAGAMKGQGSGGAKEETMDGSMSAGGCACQREHGRAPQQDAAHESLSGTPRPSLADDRGGVDRRVLLAGTMAALTTLAVGACASPDQAASPGESSAEPAPAKSESATPAHPEGESATPEQSDTAPTDTESASAADGGSGEAVAGTGDFPVGGGVVVTTEAGVVVVTHPADAEFKAFNGKCPHAGCPVTEVTENTIVCMCHGSTFDGTTGERLEGPAPTGLQPVAIAVEGDLIYLT